MPILGIIASSVQKTPAGSYESIASIAGTGSSGTITFSSIPSTYTSLQVRMIVNDGADNIVNLRINGDTAANYADHQLSGDGSTVLAGGLTGRTSVRYVGRAPSIASTYGASIIDIHNYTSTTQNKTVRAFMGRDQNGTGEVYLSSGVWLSTAAVTSLTIFCSGNFTTASSFALYGIKGA